MILRCNQCPNSANYFRTENGEPISLCEDCHTAAVTCPTCHHPNHGTNRCDRAITEEIRVGSGTYNPTGIHWGDDIVDTCRCDGDTL